MIALDPPRWPNGPPICPVSNLPAFESWDQAQKFMDAHCGSEMAKWRCTGCGCWHYWAKPHAPAGGSSGTTRHYQIPKSVQEMISRTRVHQPMALYA